MLSSDSGERLVGTRNQRSFGALAASLVQGHMSTALLQRRSERAFQYIDARSLSCSDPSVVVDFTATCSRESRLGPVEEFLFLCHVNVGCMRNRRKQSFLAHCEGEYQWRFFDVKLRCGFG